MKKLWMIAIAGVFFFASCCNKPKEVATEQGEEQTEETKCCKELTEEQKAAMAAWEDWDNQTPEKKAELVANAKECIDKKMAEHAEKHDGEQKEMCPEKAEKCAAFKAKWEKWDELNIEEQKALIDEKMEFCHKNCEKKEAEGCCKKGE